MRAGPAARRPSRSLDATDGATAPRGAKRANWILAVGLVLTSYRRYSAKCSCRVPNSGVRFAHSVVCAGALDPGGKASKTMTRKTQDWVVRRRRDLDSDHGFSTPSPVIDTDRSRQSAQRAGGTRTETDPHGPSDPRFAYLTRSFD